VTYLLQVRRTRLWILSNGLVHGDYGIEKSEHTTFVNSSILSENYQPKNIHATNEFLLLFFENLILDENHILKNREMHIKFVEPVNDLVKAKKDPVNDPVNDSIKSKILQQLKQNPKANYRELADKTGYSTATIKRHIQVLKKMGIIERVGSDKTGHWEIIEK
jgi:predicted HTH transcriptional regulator